MKIKMKRTVFGADTTPEGRPMPVQKYHEGDSYDVSEDLAKTFRDMNACEEVRKSLASDRENKDAGKPIRRASRK